MHDLPWACPRCRGRLERTADDRLACTADGRVFERHASIWRFLDRGDDATEGGPPPGQGAAADPGRAFRDHYRAVRRAEGWGSDDPAYYRRLPAVDAGDPAAALWRIRAASLSRLEALLDAASSGRSPMSTAVRTAVDLGAGNGWLSHRLAGRGITTLALDRSDDPRDGLGAHPAYGSPTPFALAQACFDRVPLAGGSVDLVVFNGSLHHSFEPSRSLAEARRLLGPGGRVVLMDTPIYRSREAGLAMREEQRADLARRFGLASARTGPAGFLTFADLEALGEACGLGWEVRPLPLGWRWRLGPLRARLGGRREPTRFPFVVGRPAGDRARAQSAPQLGGAGDAHAAGRTSQ